ncbi:MAG: hypothetical protein ABI432_13595 [Flavobacteriales bacterium]
MKTLAQRTYVSALLFLATSSTFSQQPIWLKTYGEPGQYNNKGFRLSEGDVGFLYGGGAVDGPNVDFDGTEVEVVGDIGTVIVKWNTDGNVQWVRTGGGNATDFETEGISELHYDVAEQQLLALGYFTGTVGTFGSQSVEGLGGMNHSDAVVLSYDEDGACLWARSIVGASVGASTLIVDPASQVFVFGSTSSGWATFMAQVNIVVASGGYIGKYASDGTLLSAERILEHGELYSASLVGTSWVLGGYLNNNAVLYGQPVPISSNIPEGYLAKADTTGVLDWTLVFPSLGGSSVSQCVTNVLGQTVAAGYFIGELYLPNDTLYGEPGQYSCFITSIDPEGETDWTSQLVGSGLVALSDVRYGPEGDVYVSGVFRGNLSLDDHVLTALSSEDGFVARYSPNGACLAAWNFGKASMIGSGMLPSLGGFYLSTTFDSTLVIDGTVVPSNYANPDPASGGDLFLAKFNSLSGFTVIQPMPLQGGDGLLIHANPNNGQCSIDLPASIVPGSDLVLTIFDAGGRVVQQVPLLISNGTVQLDIQAQAKGLYHLELQSGERRYTGTIVFE